VQYKRALSLEPHSPTALSALGSLCYSLRSDFEVRGKLKYEEQCAGERAREQKSEHENGERERQESTHKKENSTHKRWEK